MLQLWCSGSKRGDAVIVTLTVLLVPPLQILTALAEAAPPLALRLLLQCAEVASSCDLEPMSYDLFTQAYMIYEEDIAVSPAGALWVHLVGIPAPPPVVPCSHLISSSSPFLPSKKEKESEKESMSLLLPTCVRKKKGRKKKKKKGKGRKEK